MKHLIKSSLFICLLIAFALGAQNENVNWYFGSYAGLNFSTNPPTILNNSAMYSSEGCAAVSDGVGNLLFYTDGITIWNKNHQIMANGTGLMGHPSAAQSGLVLKQPGNPNLYYVFTVDVAGGTNGLRYTIVNMALAAGMGSVTVKNTLLYSPCTEKLTAVRTSNGSDFWVVTHEWGSANFRSYKLTAAGVNTNCAVSTTGLIHGGSNIQNAVGCMKISPNGQKLGLAISNQPFNSIELFDFNTFNGVVSNQCTLSTNGFVYGVEFSPNSSKFYATQINVGGFFMPCLTQWDLTNNNNSVIQGSAYNYFAGVNQNIQNFGMQLAPNGKIYIASYLSHSLSVINNPDLQGAASGFVNLSQNLGAGVVLIGLPAFLSMPYAAKNITATYKNQSCNGDVDFYSPVSFSTSLSNNSVSGFSATSMQWDFGDPSSSANTATTCYTTHHYHQTGNYTVTLIIHYTNGVDPDTLRSQVSILQIEPTFTVSGNTVICEKDPLSFGISGSTSLYNFYWMGPNLFFSQTYQNQIAATNSLMTGKYVCHGTYNNTCHFRDSLYITVNPIPLVALQNATVCLHESIELIGTGAQKYFWKGPQGDTGSFATYPLVVNNLNYSGIYTLIGTNMTGCSNTSTMQLTVRNLPSLEAHILPSTRPCLNSVLSFATPSQYTTEWRGPNNFYTNKPLINIWANNMAMTGNYSLTLRDDLGCQSKTVIPITIQALPEIDVAGLVPAACPPLNIHYRVINPTPSTQVSWETQNHKNIGFQFEHSFNQSGNYTVSAKIYDSYSQCSNSYTYPIQVWPQSKAEFFVTPGEPMEGIDLVTLHNRMPYMEQNEYQWDISNGFSSQLKKDPSIMFDNAGNYSATLKVKNPYGCVDTCSKNIQVKANVSVYVPNVFTPNQDRLNDLFIPVVNGAKTTHLRIFNRWGNMVYESMAEPFAWDGNYLNQHCQEDTYYWTLEYQPENTQSKSSAGSILLMR